MKGEINFVCFLASTWKGAFKNTPKFFSKFEILPLIFFQNEALQPGVVDHRWIDRPFVWIPVVPGVQPGR